MARQSFPGEGLLLTTRAAASSKLRPSLPPVTPAPGQNLLSSADGP